LDAFADYGKAASKHVFAGGQQGLSIFQENLKQTFKLSRASKHFYPHSNSKVAEVWLDFGERRFTKPV
jgi:hypothetical protein